MEHPGKRSVGGYYTPKKLKLLKDFDKSEKYGANVLTSHYGNDLAATVMKETREELERLIPAYQMSVARRTSSR
jgi:hypothetical protein